MIKQQPGWVLPNLREAQKRTHQDSKIEKALFSIPPQCQGIGQGKKYYLRTYGCQANERDSETLAGILEALQFTSTADPEDADLILMNTCAVRKNAEDKVLGEIGHFKRLAQKRDDLVIGVCGCMAQEESIVNTLLETYRHVNLIFGTHNLHRLPELLYQVMIGHEKSVEVFSKEGDVIENLPVRRFGKYKAWVNIMYGCDKFCTYCIVPYTRGKERSRKMEDILEEVRILKEEGYREITLLGQNVNAYGKDIGIEGGFARLLEETAKTGIDRIRFTTSHPWDFSDAMIDVIAAYDNIMPFIHLPVQSGDSDILKIMGRRYTIEEYRTLFDKIMEKIPNCAVSTDTIVGFPNESDEQFEHTMDIVDYCKFDNAFTFIYSKRTGTPAAVMEDQVSEAEVKDRFDRLLKEVQTISAQRCAIHEGTIQKALVECQNEHDPSLVTGRLSNNLLVHFPGDPSLIGRLVDVSLDECKGFYYMGKMKDTE